MEPNMAGLRRIKVRASAVADAIAQGRAVSDDWQAQNLEIALLPNVAKRLADVNRGATVTRHKGLPHKGMSRDDNAAVTDWSAFAGYVVTGFGGVAWNRVGEGRERGYCHGPSRAWDGMRRECFCAFLGALHYAYNVEVLGSQHASYAETLRKYRIEFVNDIKDEFMGR